ncbi:type 4 pilus major pilin [Pseudomonas sp. DCB_CB]|uniref:type 4 pilus major pilin n=1 Tax=unclassified Pseudomonas TaxID=196821 RepID=UPI002248C764|nr:MULTISPECIES: type 4 pilus major pilin [unclassified Pseudomonas]MCX2694507.1 type 4 pilus major pilin [Pseudomonas sp. DCB_BZ]MCX2859663.1 type 4 pilus major pilin [Pseudomonas sp. DCB_CB]
MKLFKKSKIKKNQVGAMSAIEMALIIAVGVVALYAAVAYGPKLWASSDNSRELENISSLVTNVRNLKTVSGYGASGTNLVPQLITAGAVPGPMTISGTTIINTWGGVVTIVSTGYGFTVTAPSIPATGCIFLATKFAATGSVTTKINSGTAVSGEVTSAAATTGCNGATNTIVWSSAT